MKVQEILGEPGTYVFFCPGCNMHHQVITGGNRRPRWGFNGSLRSPTFTPSLLVRYPGEGEMAKDRVCHSFIKEGKIQYLSDCTHEFKGMTVEIPSL